MNPNGKCYIVGLNPIPDTFDGDGDVFCRVTKIRDACILLAGHRCYREYPIEWVVRSLEQAGFVVDSTKRFPILYTAGSMIRQINVARSKLQFFRNSELREGMRSELDKLELEAHRACPEGKKIKLGFDYVVCASI